MSRGVCELGHHRSASSSRPVRNRGHTGPGLTLAPGLLYGRPRCSWPPRYTVAASLASSSTPAAGNAVRPMGRGKMTAGTTRDPESARPRTSPIAEPGESHHAGQESLEAARAGPGRASRWRDQIVFGFAWVCYCGRLTNNRHSLVVACALANLFMVRRRLLRLQWQSLSSDEHRTAEAKRQTPGRRTAPSCRLRIPGRQGALSL
jgi:hypothetical protein